MDGLTKYKAAALDKSKMMEEKTGPVAHLLRLLKKKIRKVTSTKENVPKTGNKPIDEKIQETEQVNPQNDGAPRDTREKNVQKENTPILDKMRFAFHLARQETDDRPFFTWGFDRPEDTALEMRIQIIPTRRCYYPPYTEGCYTAWDPAQNFRYLYDIW